MPSLAEATMSKTVSKLSTNYTSIHAFCV